MQLTHGQVFLHLHRLVQGVLPMGKCSGQGSGEGLVTTAAALAIAISQNRTADELEVLAVFLTALGDNLALLALKAPKECK